MLMHTVNHYRNLEREEATDGQSRDDDSDVASKVRHSWQTGKRRAASVWNDLQGSVQTRSEVWLLAGAALVYGHATKPLQDAANQVADEKQTYEEHVVNVKPSYSEPEQLRRGIRRQVKEHAADAKIALYRETGVYGPDKPCVGEASISAERKGFVLTCPAEFTKQTADSEIHHLTDVVNSEVFFGVRKLRCVKGNAKKEVTPDTTGAGLYDCNESYPPIRP